MINKLKINILNLTLILILFGLLGVTLAKYVSGGYTGIKIRAKAFYFESNMSIEGEELNDHVYAIGNDVVALDLKNNVDNLRISEVDIEYAVTITDEEGNIITDKNGNEVEEITGVLSKGSIDTQRVEFNNLPFGKYIVTAKAVKPYTKTLSYKVVLREKDEEIKYSVNDIEGNPIVQLIVKTKDFSGDIEINWEDGIAPDSTNAKFTNVDSGYSAGSAIVNFNIDSEYIFQFYKKDPTQVYTKENFSLKKVI